MLEQIQNKRKLLGRAGCGNGGAPRGWERLR
jgi:hypothetical protein